MQQEPNESEEQLRASSVLSMNTTTAARETVLDILADMAEATLDTAGSAAMENTIYLQGNDVHLDGLMDSTINSGIHDIMEDDELDQDYQDFLAEDDEEEEDSDEEDSNEEDSDHEQELPPHHIYNGMRDQADALTVIDVTPEMIASGTMDLQGISWNLTFHTRAEARQERLLQYVSYANLGVDRSQIMNEIHSTKKENNMFRFRYTKRDCHCSIVHFQLRHLLAATSKNDIYFPNGQHVKHWSPISRTSSDVMSLTGPLSRINITTLDAQSNMLIIGGFCGEYAFKRLDSKQISVFPFPWAANCSDQSPDKRLLCVIGDNPEGLIISADSGEELCQLKGHIDFSFSCAWSPCGTYIATGNQDCTTRIYDIRRSDQAVVVLGTDMGAVRSLGFSQDGKFLAVAEPADFVHIVDMDTVRGHQGEGNREDKTVSVQTVEFFGEIAGVAFAGAHGERLFIGNEDFRIGGLMEFEKRPMQHHSGIDWDDAAAIVL
ncbi:hypothetical protein BDEG_23999 [Batrachochytrium dendrobatidis JEL423]|uniref:Uncharacterized protein n=1 Tax=Batrachochytrium dendrobatidis (strain JEL423) TaxID=403673 RepID=A0A177WKB3_BATDL|nr:hypothetical protein BDEG_23999 [Batrachochytrium dendrobatidis JEL423]